MVIHAKKFIEESKNVENYRARGKVERMSAERMIAGPAIPMIYDYMKTKYDDLARVLEEEGKDVNKLKSADIIECGLERGDPLCMLVVEKFTEWLGVEAGNLALKTLPTGGIYLIGGVTQGIHKYII